MMKRAVVKQVKELTMHHILTRLVGPQQESRHDISDFVAACQKYGQVSAPGFPDPSKCHATGKGRGSSSRGDSYCSPSGH